VEFRRLSDLEVAAWEQLREVARSVIEPKVAAIRSAIVRRDFDTADGLAAALVDDFVNKALTQLGPALGKIVEIQRKQKARSDKAARLRRAAAASRKTRIWNSADSFAQSGVKPRALVAKVAAALNLQGVEVSEKHVRDVLKLRKRTSP
jgi:hypothetical protein